MITSKEALFKLVRLHALADRKTKDWGSRKEHNVDYPENLVYLRTSDTSAAGDLRIHGTWKKKFVEEGLIELRKHYSWDGYDSCFATEKAVKEAFEEIKDLDPVTLYEYDNLDGYMWSDEYINLWHNTGLVKWLWENQDLYDMRLEDMSGIKAKFRLLSNKEEGEAWYKIANLRHSLSACLNNTEADQVAIQRGLPLYKAKGALGDILYADGVLHGGPKALLAEANSNLLRKREEVMDALNQYALAKAARDVVVREFKDRKPSEIAKDLAVRNVAKSNRDIQDFVKDVLG